MAATAIASASLTAAALADVGPTAYVPAPTAANPFLSALPAGEAYDRGKGAHRRREVGGFDEGPTCGRAHARGRMAKCIRKFGYTTMAPDHRPHASLSL